MRAVQSVNKLEKRVVKGVRNPYQLSSKQCPNCYNRVMADIIVIRADFLECRICGYSGDSDNWKRG